MRMEDVGWVRHNCLLWFHLSPSRYLPLSLSFGGALQEELVALRTLQGEDPNKMMRAFLYSHTYEQSTLIIIYHTRFFSHQTHYFSPRTCTCKDKTCTHTVSFFVHPCSNILYINTHTHMQIPSVTMAVSKIQ